MAAQVYLGTRADRAACPKPRCDLDLHLRVSTHLPAAITFAIWLLAFTSVSLLSVGSRSSSAELEAIGLVLLVLMVFSAPLLLLMGIVAAAIVIVGWLTIEVSPRARGPVRWYRFAIFFNLGVPLWAALIALS